VIAFKYCSPGDRIARGQFYRVTWMLNAWDWLLHEQLEVQVFGETYNKLARTGLVAPVSDLEVTPGDKVMVVDLLVQSRAEGLTVSQLANVLHELRISLRVHSIEKIDHSIAQDPGGRKAAQDLANAEKESSDWFTKFSGQLRYLKWILILLVVAALLLAASKAIGAARSR